MRVLIDTDVLIDVALKRPKFFHDSKRILEWVETVMDRAQLLGIPFLTWHT